MVRFSLSQLTYFVTAANIGSVSAAARRLNISQPSISAAISHFEEVNTADGGGKDRLRSGAEAPFTGTGSRAIAWG
jgi:molybdenum-dependent DNA-binding transcriptional regulator ModE